MAERGRFIRYTARRRWVEWQALRRPNLVRIGHVQEDRRWQATVKGAYIPKHTSDSGAILDGIVRSRPI